MWTCYYLLKFNMPLYWCNNKNIIHWHQLYLWKFMINFVVVMDWCSKGILDCLNVLYNFESFNEFWGLKCNFNKIFKEDWTVVALYKKKSIKCRDTQFKIHWTRINLNIRSIAVSMASSFKMLKHALPPVQNF